MDEQLAAQGIRFRDFHWEDIPALADIRMRTSPEHPGSQERMEYFEKTYPADNPRLRFDEGTWLRRNNDPQRLGQPGHSGAQSTAGLSAAPRHSVVIQTTSALNTRRMDG